MDEPFGQCTRTSAGESARSRTSRLMPYTWNWMSAMGPSDDEVGSIISQLLLGLGRLRTPHHPDGQQERDQDEDPPSPRASDEKLASAEEAEIHDGAAYRPSEQTAVARPFFLRGADHLDPAAPARTHALIEPLQMLHGLRRGEMGHHEPAHRRARHGQQHEPGKAARAVDVESHAELKPEREGEGGDHGRHFRPRVDPPPVPAQEIDQAGAGADGEEELPRALHR